MNDLMNIFRPISVALIIASAVTFFCIFPPGTSLSADDAGQSPVGRYQLIVGTAQSGKLLLLRLDTQTGRVWIYDEQQQLQVTEEYIAENDLSGIITLEQLRQYRAQGKEVYVPPYWNEIPNERPSSIVVFTPHAPQTPVTKPK
jgi:hypothetical protein